MLIGLTRYAGVWTSSAKGPYTRWPGQRGWGATPRPRTLTLCFTSLQVNIVVQSRCLDAGSVRACHHGQHRELFGWRPPCMIEQLLPAHLTCCMAHSLLLTETTATDSALGRGHLAYIPHLLGGACYTQGSKQGILSLGLKHCAETLHCYDHSYANRFIKLCAATRSSL